MRGLGLALIMLLQGCALAEASAFELSTGNYFVVVVVALVIALLIVGKMRAKLKTAKRQSAAENYIREGSLDMRVCSDRFLYRTTSRRRIESNNKK